MILHWFWYSFLNLEGLTFKWVMVIWILGWIPGGLSDIAVALNNIVSELGHIRNAISYKDR